MRYGDDTLGCYCGGIRVRYPCPRCEQKLMVPRRGGDMRHCHKCGQDRVCEMVRGVDLCVQACAPYARQQERERERAELVEHVRQALRVEWEGR